MCSFLFPPSDAAKDLEFRNIFLTTYMDFATSEDVFQALASRFGPPEAADSYGGLVTLRNKYAISYVCGCDWTEISV
jgi:hypothetical protein